LSGQVYPVTPPHPCRKLSVQGLQEAARHSGKRKRTQNPAISPTRDWLPKKTHSRLQFCEFFKQIREFCSFRDSGTVSLQASKQEPSRSRVFSQLRFKPRLISQNSPPTPPDADGPGLPNRHRPNWGFHSLPKARRTGGWKRSTLPHVHRRDHGS